jgi:predicted dehydrogenase
MKTKSQTTPRFFHNPQAQRSLAAAHTERSPSSEGYKFNLIGAGMIGREHMRVITLLGKAKVHGIYDTDRASIELAKATYSGYSKQPLLVYDDLESACLDDVDGIIICTPNFTHYGILNTAMKSGKPIFMEKPMATTLSEAADIVRLEQSYSSFIQLGMQYRFKSQYSEAFNLVKAQGLIGDVRTISMSEYRPPFLDKVQQWNKFNENTGGTLVEKCCHYFDLINLMAEARPTRIFATGGQAVNFLDFEYNGKKSDIADHGFVVIDYANGVRASFTLNMFCPELYEEIIITGPKGRVVASETSSFEPDTSSKAWVVLENNSKVGSIERDVTYAPLVERSGHHGATFFEHLAFIERLEGADPDSATVLQGLWSIIVAAAAQESMASSMPIEVSDFLIKQGLEEFIQ